MRFLETVLLVALSATLALASEADVLNLVDSDFSTRLAAESTTLVMFYAPCKFLSSVTHQTIANS